MTRLAGKTAIITGAARGIGKAIAAAYIAEGASVAVADVNLSGAEAVAGELGARAFAVNLDVTNRNAIDRAVAQTIRRTGGIDILVNSAAFLIWPPSPRSRPGVLTGFLPST